MLITNVHDNGGKHSAGMDFNWKILQEYSQTKTAQPELSWICNEPEQKIIGCQYQHTLISTYGNSNNIPVSRV